MKRIQIKQMKRMNRIWTHNNLQNVKLISRGGLYSSLMRPSKLSSAIAKIDIVWLSHLIWRGCAKWETNVHPIVTSTSSDVASNGRLLALVSLPSPLCAISGTIVPTTVVPFSLSSTHLFSSIGNTPTSDIDSCVLKHWKLSNLGYWLLRAQTLETLLFHHSPSEFRSPSRLSGPRACGLELSADVTRRSIRHSISISDPDQVSEACRQCACLAWRSVQPSLHSFVRGSRNKLSSFLCFCHSPRYSFLVVFLVTLFFSLFFSHVHHFTQLCQLQSALQLGQTLMIMTMWLPFW